MADTVSEPGAPACTCGKLLLLLLLLLLLRH
jgi:hypothetical protein